MKKTTTKKVSKPKKTKPVSKAEKKWYIENYPNFTIKLTNKSSKPKKISLFGAFYNPYNSVSKSKKVEISVIESSYQELQLVSIAHPFIITDIKYIVCKYPNRFHKFSKKNKIINKLYELLYKKYILQNNNNWDIIKKDICGTLSAYPLFPNAYRTPNNQLNNQIDITSKNGFNEIIIDGRTSIDFVLNPKVVVYLICKIKD